MTSSRYWKPIALILSGLMFGHVALAIDAADVDVDDTSMTTIQGDDAQAALESVDAEVTTLVGHHEGIDEDADVVYVRQDCTGIKNCFTSMEDLAGNVTGNGNLRPTHPSDLTNSAWLWSVRQPTPSDPILVDIGPGTWSGFVCPDHTEGEDFGGVTVRGSGRDTTRLEDGIAIDAQNCVAMQFMDLTAVGTAYGVRWSNGGSANWQDMDIIGVLATYGGFGWLDECTSGGTPSLHYLFSTRVIVAPPVLVDDPLFKVAYRTSCAETWFFGGEIRFDNTGLTSPLFGGALYISGGSDFRAFGTPIRVVAGDQASSTETHSITGKEELPAVVVDGNNPSMMTMFHLHGGIINVFGSSESGESYTVNMTGINVLDNAFAHTPGSAWVVRAPDGTATRVATSGGAVAQAPFLWQSGTDEPEAGLVSETGSDVFVETDCNASSGVCDGSGTSRPHMMIYDASCSPSPWFDIVTNACRDPS